LIPDLRIGAQPLPPPVQVESAKLMAMMIIHIVRDQCVMDDTVEVHDESC